MSNSNNKKMFLALLVLIVISSLTLFNILPFAEAVTVSTSPTSEGAFAAWKTPTTAYTKVQAVKTNDGDTQYIYDALNNDRETFLFPNSVLQPGVNTINSITLHVIAKAAVTNPTKFSLSVAKGTTSNDSPLGGTQLTTSYADYTRVMTTNPFTGQPWTVSDINNWTTGGSKLSFGVTQNTNAKEVRITQVFLVIDYVDSTPPVITPTVTGTLGNNNWYTSNVQVSWAVTDPESPITSSSGCTTTNITTDTSGMTLTCTATSGGGTSTQSVTIKRDATPPIVSASLVRAPDHGTWYNKDVDTHYTATDATSGVNTCDADKTYSSPDSAIAAGPLGTCTDKAGNSASASVTSFSFDKTPPVLTVPSPITMEATGSSGAPVTFATSATDNIAAPSDISIVCIPTSGSTFPYTPNPSKSTLTNDNCVATDEAGNTDIKSFGVTITDTTPPVITILDSNPIRVQSHTSYSDAGATASDIVDGDLTSKISVTNGVDPSNPGVYTVSYDVSDTSTNAAPTAIRTVDVVEVLFSAKKYDFADTAIVSVTDNLSTGRPDPVTVLVESFAPGSTTARGSVTVTLAPTGIEGTFDNSANQINFVTAVDTSNPETQLVAQAGDNLKVTYLGSFTYASAINPPGVSVLAFAGTAPPSTDIVRFYESDKYYPTQSATVKVNDASAPSLVTVHVSSTSDPTGFDISLAADIGSTTSFTSLSSLSFDPVSSVPSSNIIQAVVGDTVTATYGSNTATATIVNDPSSAIASLTSYSPDTTIRSTCAGDADTDGDGICDSWEDQALHSGSLVIPSSLTGTQYPIACTPSATYTTDPTGATVCPSKTAKDVYVEIDYMQGHLPSPTAIADVVKAFKAAPVKGTPTGPINGIALHVFVDEQVPHIASIPYSSTDPSAITVLSLKKQFFGTATERTSLADPTLVTKLLAAKRQVFHWGLFIHDQTGNPQSSGLGEKPGNDFVVSMGEFAGHVGSTQQQESTLMHEIGHNLGLDHGGADSINCKGNYPSVMNYLFQFDSSNGGLLQSRPLDFSRVKFPTISESGLSESTTTFTGGATVLSTLIGGITGSGTPITPFVTNIGGTTGVKIDWNQNKVTESTTYPENTHYFTNIPGCDDKSVAALNSQNDWASLVYNFRPSSTFDSGVITIHQTHSDASTVGTPDPETAKPDVNAGSDVTINEGDTYSPNITISDVDSTSWTVDIDYGDGSTNTVTVSSTSDIAGIDHKYADNGDYAVKVQVTNNRGGTNSGSLTVHVKNVPPAIGAISISPSSSVTFGTSQTFSATFTDPGINDVHTAIWNWGDGTTSTGTVTESGGAGSVTNDHKYSTGGTYTVTLTVSDGIDSATATTTSTVKQYVFGGFTSPIPNSEYNAGRTLPVKFTINDGSGNPVTTAIAKIYVFTGTCTDSGPTSCNLANSIPGTSNTQSGNTAVYSSGVYQYNLNTSSFHEGKTTIIVSLDDGTIHTVTITFDK